MLNGSGSSVPRIQEDSPALVLAPMEGVTDAAMRAVQGERGVFTHAVSEFVRVSHAVLTRTVFVRQVPELLTGCRTPTGLPVQVQLLGGDPALMAASAVAAYETGATAVDINFGCPAKTVNRHDGGATLLKYPSRIREIVAAVRTALPRNVPVSAKLRLGWDDIDAIDENAARAAEGGASWLTIHARTRTQGYAPPVFWEPIRRVRESLGIPIVANGDIWTLQDFRRCREITGCRHFMLGRGALADPRLPHLAAVELGLPHGPAHNFEPVDWPSQLLRLVDWSGRFQGNGPERVVARLKQWLKFAACHGSFDGFEAVKRTRTADELLCVLRSTSIGKPQR
jgi:tRNA-dihydrouridine synthase C